MRISPSDAAVAARSFPRRWRELFASVDDPAVLERSGARELAAAAADALGATAARLGGIPDGASGGDEIARITEAALALANAVDAIPTDGWSGDPIVALAAGVDEAATLLRQAERAVEAAS